MMQSKEDFTPKFAKASVTLRVLTKHGAYSNWNSEHQNCFEQILISFRKDILMRYSDIQKFIYSQMRIYLRAILDQGNTTSDAKLVAVTSRTTNAVVKKYPKQHFEAYAKDFALRKFRIHLVGAPNISVITDHRPFCSILLEKNKDQFWMIISNCDIKI